MIGATNVSNTNDVSVRTLYALTPRNMESDNSRKAKQARDELDDSFMLPSAFHIHERLSTGPLSKWRQSRKIPWKLMTHIVILILVSVLALLYTYNRQYFFRLQGEAFADVFLPPDHLGNWESGYDNYIAYLTEHEEVVEDINKTVVSYFSLVDNNVDTILYLPKSREESEEIRPIRAELALWKESPRNILKSSQSQFDAKLDRYVDELSEDAPLGTILNSLMNNDTRGFLDRMEYLKLRFSFQSLDTSYVSPWRIVECIQWTLVKEYEFHGSGSLSVILTYEYDKCENVDYRYRHQFYKPSIWVSLMLIVVSLISQFLNFKSLLKRIRLFFKLRKIQTTKGYSAMVSNLSAAEKLGISSTSVRWIDLPKFISFWFVVQFVADICNISGFFILLFAHIDPVFPRFILGAGMMLSWVATIRFFQYAPSFYALIATIRNGVPNILRFLVCVLPIFVGFGFAGTIIFGHYNKNFDDIFESLLSLFCMLNGDAIHDTFQALFGVNVFLAYFSRVYIYCFCVLFICTVINIIILIMQDAFTLSREQFKEKEEAETQVREHVRKSMRLSVPLLNITDVIDDDEDEESEHSNDDQLSDFVNDQNTKHSLTGNMKEIRKEESVAENIERILHAVSDKVNSTDDEDIREEQQRMLRYLNEVVDLLKRDL